MNIHLPPQARWVTSLGGPLLLLPESAVTAWTGIEPSQSPRTKGITFRWRGDPNGPVTDYDRACSVEGYIGLIDVGDAKGVVLGGEPNSTTWVPIDGGGLLVRWVYADDEGSLLRSLVGLSEGSFERAELTLPVLAGPLLLFDSASSGGNQTPEEALVIPVPPST